MLPLTPRTRVPSGGSRTLTSSVKSRVRCQLRHGGARIPLSPAFQPGRRRSHVVSPRGPGRIRTSKGAMPRPVYSRVPSPFGHRPVCRAQIPGACLSSSRAGRTSPVRPAQGVLFDARRLIAPPLGAQSASAFFRGPAINGWSRQPPSGLAPDPVSRASATTKKAAR